MARAKNANKLSSGFYRAHDFLRFGDVIGSINAGKKGDWKNQAMQMAQLQSVNNLVFLFQIYTKQSGAITLFMPLIHTVRHATKNMMPGSTLLSFNLNLVYCIKLFRRKRF